MLSKIFSRCAASSSAALRFQAKRNVMTRAVVLNETESLEIRDIDIEEPFTDDDVKIDIHSVGICGSDVHYYEHGSIGPFVVRQPMVLGHECAGVVTDVGKNVTHLKVGDRVCMEPGIPDPNSRASRLGMYNVDPKVRFWATPPYHQDLLDNPAWAAGHGCLRNSVVHPASFTYKIPDHISFDEGAMVEPLAVGMWAATKAKIKPGDVSLVMGAGPIGMMTAISALAAGSAKVYITDISAAKLAVAEKLTDPGKIIGIDVSEMSQDELSQTMKDRTEGWGADIVFECTGNCHAASQVPSVASPGGAAVFVGCPSHPTPLSVADMQVRELRTESIFRYANVYPKAIALLESGSIDLKPIVTNVYDFEDSVDAFDFMRNPPPETIKTVIRLNHDEK